MHVYVYIYMCVCIYKYIHMYVRVCVRVCVCVCVSFYVFLSRQDASYNMICVTTDRISSQASTPFLGVTDPIAAIMQIKMLYMFFLV